MFTAAVALNDDSTADQLQEHGSPVHFEVLGDGGSVLWQSKPVSAPKEVQEVSISVLEVSELTLRVWVEGSAKYAHAVWLAPTLTACTDWSCDGWRNDKSTFRDALTGTRRGEVSPLPAVGEDVTTQGGVAAAALAYAGLLANEYLRDMRNAASASASSDGVSLVDLEAPFSIQVAADVLRRITSLLEAAIFGTVPRALLPPLLALVRTNVRRLVVSRVDPKAVGLRGSSESKADGDDGAAESKSDAAAGDASGDDDVLAALHAALRTVAASPDVSDSDRATALGIESAAIKLLLPAQDDRVTRFKAAVPAGGVVEVQLNFPCDVNAPDSGASVPFDALVLLLQMRARENGWKSTVSWRKGGGGVSVCVVLCCVVVLLGCCGT